jgi:hypothetical protein
MQNNETMIRDYLLRCVADRNKRISGCLHSVVKSNRCSYNVGFNEILGFFANGINSEIMTQVFEHMENNPQKKFSAYNYFDIDTLYAYDTYLKSILSETDIVSAMSGHRYATATDFQKGFSVAKSKWADMFKESSQENGYYNARTPVKLAKTLDADGYTILNPKKAMSEEQFNKKYNKFECKKALVDYLEYRHNVKNNMRDSQTDVFNYIKYNHNGKTYNLYVIDRKYYCDIEGRGVIQTIAEGREGRLYTSKYNDGSVYEGEYLYDLDGQIVASNEGGEIFYPNKDMFNAVQVEEETVKHKETEDGQLYLF